jgi:hypothetical protein
MASVITRITRNMMRLFRDMGDGTHAPQTFVASGSVIASDGAALPIDSLAQVPAYTSGNLTSLTVTHGGSSYRQTFTYVSGVLTNISGWVKQ